MVTHSTKYYGHSNVQEIIIEMFYWIIRKKHRIIYENIHVCLFIWHLLSDLEHKTPCFLGHFLHKVNKKHPRDTV